MAEQTKKTTLASVTASLERARNTVAGMREKGTELTKEGVRTLVSGTTALTAGFLNQRYGEVDAETGIRVHKVNGAPSALVAGACGKVVAAFGIAGDASFAVYGAADGAIGEGMGTAGRQIGERFRRKAESESSAETKSGAKTAERKVA
jgi:hypothetical protein